MPLLALFTRALLLGMLFVPAPVPAATDVTQKVAALLSTQGLTGAVWTTLDAQGAAGVSDARKGTPMQAGQRVHVGSVAKTLLATGILRLASERRLALDTPVSLLLPGMAFDNPWEASDPVRLRHLLDHTSGLDDIHLWHVFSLSARAGDPLAAAFPKDGGLLRVRHRPGARFSYSNLGYTLLGMVIEAVVKQPYEAYLDAALLAPLGMHDSTFAFVTQDGDARLAMGHFEDGVAQPAVPSYVRPATQFTTTAADMGRFARFLMGDGRIAGKPFIDAALLRQMGEPTGTEAARAGLRVGYGLGLRTLDRHGVIGQCHSGNGIGFRAMLCLFPETRKAFFIAINADSEGADYPRFDEVLVRAIMPVMSGAPVARAAALPAFDVRGWEGFYIPSPNRFDSMRFVDTVFGFLQVGRSAGGLRLAPFQSAALELRHAGGGLFQAPGRLLPSHALLTSPEGARIISNGTQSYEQVPLVRLLAWWASVAAGLLGLAAIMLMGLARLLQRMSRHDPLLAPFAAVLALLLPLPLFYRQSFLQLGELTLASGLLAAATATLPLAMLAGLWMAWRRAALRSRDTAAMLAVLQLCLMLAGWELLPLRLWA